MAELSDGEKDAISHRGRSPAGARGLAQPASVMPNDQAKGRAAALSVAFQRDADPGEADRRHRDGVGGDLTEAVTPRSTCWHSSSRWSRCARPASRPTPSTSMATTRWRNLAAATRGRIDPPRRGDHHLRGDHTARAQRTCAHDRRRHRRDRGVQPWSTWWSPGSLPPSPRNRLGRARGGRDPPLSADAVLLARRARRF